MPKPNNSIQSVKIGITTTQRVALFLDNLIATEIFGKSRAEVAEQLIKRSMEEFLMTDRIDKLNKKL
jgi:hypothetical protein